MASYMQDLCTTAKENEARGLAENNTVYNTLMLCTIQEEDNSPTPRKHTSVLPTVELTKLFTDVSSVVRDQSSFTQYMNLCYRADKDSKTVVFEVAPIEVEHGDDLDPG